MAFPTMTCPSCEPTRALLRATISVLSDCVSALDRARQHLDRVTDELGRDLTVNERPTVPELPDAPTSPRGKAVLPPIDVDPTITVVGPA